MLTNQCIATGREDRAVRRMCAPTSRLFRPLCMCGNVCVSVYFGVCSSPGSILREFARARFAEKLHTFERSPAQCNGETKHKHAILYKFGLGRAYAAAKPVGNIHGQFECTWAMRCVRGASNTRRGGAHGDIVWPAQQTTG